LTKRLFSFLIALILVFTTMAPVYAEDDYDFSLSLSGGSEYKQGDRLTVVGTVAKNGNAYPGVAVAVKIDAKSYDARMHSDMVFANAKGEYSFTNIRINEEYIKGTYTVSVNAAGKIKTLEFKVVDATHSDNDKDDDKGSSGKGSGTSSPVTQQPTDLIKLTPVYDQSSGIAAASLGMAELNSAMSAAKADVNGIKHITVNLAAVQGARAYDLKLPSQYFAFGAEKTTRMILMNTSLGTVSIPDNMLPAGLAASGSTIGISLGLADTSSLPAELKAKIGDRPVYDLNLEVNGVRKDWSNPNVPVTIAVVYKPTPEELSNPDGIVIWYLDPVTNLPVAVPNCKYDPVTGMVTFKVTHFSKYAVAYAKTSFKDTAAYTWAKKQIDAVAVKGILQPVSEEEFIPSAAITRAEFMYGLVRSLGLTAKVEGSFSDIEPSAYYYNEVGIARKLGITNGAGNNKFMPDTAITRQDMMTLIVKALEVAGKLKDTKGADLGGFADNASIAAYARQNVSIVVAEGIIKGDGKNINPHGNTTRAEAAVILYRIFNK